jgi:hypothetical protein
MTAAVQSAHASIGAPTSCRARAHWRPGRRIPYRLAVGPAVLLALWCAASVTHVLPQTARETLLRALGATVSTGLHEEACLQQPAGAA